MQINPFNLIGIFIRTTNENGQSGIDIPLLWQKFLVDAIAEKIPGKIDPAIYVLYTDYEKDHTKPYTTLIGCKVASLDIIPDNMTGKIVEGGQYSLYQATGNIHQGIVFDAWVRIWNNPLPRRFTTDFEVYGAKATVPENAIVDIFVAR